MKKGNLLFIFTILGQLLWSQSGWLSPTHPSDSDKPYLISQKANHGMTLQILEALGQERLLDSIRAKAKTGLNPCQFVPSYPRSLSFIQKQGAKPSSAPLPDDGLASKGAAPKDWWTIGNLAHELGHLIGHQEQNATPQARELQADEWAGIALRKMGASLQEARQYVQKRAAQNQLMDPRPDRLEAVELGYDRYDLKKAITVFHKGDFTRAYKLLIFKNLELDAEGFWCLAQLQEYGRGGAIQNNFDAACNYKRAIEADESFCPAYAGLARLAQAKKTDVTAWQKKAASHNCPDGLFYMGYFMEQCGKPAQAIEYYEKAIEYGSVRALHNLAELYQMVLRDDGKAVACYQKAAALGFKDSINYLKEHGLPLRE